MLSLPGKNDFAVDDLDFEFGNESSSSISEPHSVESGPPPMFELDDNITNLITTMENHYEQGLNNILTILP